MGIAYSNIIAIAAIASVGACASHPSRQDVFEMPGRQMYEQLCTSCHGVSGKGNGPMTPLLTIDVPDLTRIAARHGGEFPTEYVKGTIDGRIERRAHGLPYMPVWGVEFEKDATPARADASLNRLVDYLRSIQQQG